MSAEGENTSQALQDSVETLCKESKRLREVYDRLMREAEELKKLIPKEPQKDDPVS